MYTDDHLRQIVYAELDEILAMQPRGSYAALDADRWRVHCLLGMETYVSPVQLDWLLHFGLIEEELYVVSVKARL